MKNKYVMNRSMNVKFLMAHYTEYLYSCMKLARYDVTEEMCEKESFDNEEWAKAYANFKKAFDSIMNDKDEIDYAYLLKLHAILMDGLTDDIRNELTEEERKLLVDMINQPAKANTEIAIDVMMMILSHRLFKDGDVRVAIAFANKIMLENGCGVITVPHGKDAEFRMYLKGFHNNKPEEFKNWIYQYCIRGKQVDY